MLEKKDRIFGVICIIAGIIVIYATSRIELKIKLSPNDAGPWLFPYISAIGILLCGAGIFIRNRPCKQYLTKEGWLRAGRLMLVLVGYVIVMKYVGFIFSTIIMLYIVTMILADRKKVGLLKASVFSVLTTVIVYFAFEKLFYILLPVGQLF